MPNLPNILLITILVFSCSPNSTYPNNASPNHLVSSTNESTETDPYEAAAFDTKASEFLAALRSGDKEKIRKYESDSNILIYDGGLSVEDEAFLTSELRPLILRNAIEFREWAREGRNFSVIFYASADRAKIESIDINYLREEYLSRYFICQFTEEENDWHLREGFCYAEKDDPYGSVDED